MKTWSLTLLSTAAFIALPVFAQSTAGQKGSADRMTNNTNTLSAADRTFATKAAQGGMAEVEMGNLAKDHASNQAVKDFGNRMVTDHSKANDQLKDWASKNNFTLPTDMDAKDKATYDRLSKLNGAAFDKAYISDMVTDHHKDITEFKHEGMHGSNSDLKTWANSTVPTLEDHLKAAQDAQRSVATGK
ncbi:MAG TPA: DUF4142 domain-containing protein [Bryobacteraceae bacterium]|nr:DUF4142 domain-containing protein [Bryobacteraceae bacterium]